MQKKPSKIAIFYFHPLPPVLSLSLSRRLPYFLRQCVELAAAPCLVAFHWSSRLPRMPPPLELADSALAAALRVCGLRGRRPWLAASSARSRASGTAEQGPHPRRRSGKNWWRRRIQLDIVEHPGAGGLGTGGGGSASFFEPWREQTPGSGSGHGSSGRGGAPALLRRGARGGVTLPVR